MLEYSPIRKWFVDGPDAIKVVDSIFSRDVAALPLGRLAYGVIVDDEGFMYEELTVVKYSDERILLMGGELDTQAQMQRPSRPLTREDSKVLGVLGHEDRDLCRALRGCDEGLHLCLPMIGSYTEYSGRSTSCRAAREHTSTGCYRSHHQAERLKFMNEILPGPGTKTRNHRVGPV